jgi:hypothetical protein
MAAADAPADAEVLDQLASATVKRVDFVTGAVSMETLPRAEGAEVAFIGRCVPVSVRVSGCVLCVRVCVWLCACLCA